MDFAKMRRIMVDSQIRPNDVTDPEIVSAFLRTPREAFVPKSEQAIAYAEYEIETSEGRSLWTPRDIGKAGIVAVEHNIEEHDTDPHAVSVRAFPARDPATLKASMAAGLRNPDGRR